MTENFTINIEKEAAEFKGEFKVLPPGWLKMVILTAEIKATTTGGQMLVFTYDHPDGGVNDRLNIFNNSEVAQKIGRQALAKICECCGLTGNFSLKDIPKLFGRYMDVELGIEKFKSNKPDATTGKFKDLQSNKVKNYAKAGTKSASSPAPAEQQESETEGQSTTQEQKKMPW